VFEVITSPFGLAMFTWVTVGLIVLIGTILPRA
jgi:hypothetical protein